MAIKVRYSEPKHNQHNENIIIGVSRDWNRGIHSVNKVPKPNSPRCTYCRQIKACPFIEDNVRQGFVEHFYNLNLEPTRAKNHVHFELEDLYHVRVRIPNKLK